ncbi:MAG TPA: Ku protein [Thermoanaerobaculia bacterium]|jgi:DNA end-binding protein Ku|nr:Ku protein [Thermoanaerobaculia bacterium]
MSARPFASGTIAFGLISIPIQLYSTGESAAGIQLNMMHRKCGSRLRQQYVCPVDNEVVGKDDIARGYEHAKGQYVLFSEEELKALQPEASNAIEIAEFLPLATVDPVYFEKSWYLGPDKGGDRPYRLLAEAMKETGRAALARYRARGKDQLVLLRPYETGLIMQQLRYADELRSFSEVPVGDAAEVKASELHLAVQLIAQGATEEFHPEAYEDSQRRKLRELIDRKVRGEEIAAAPEEAPQGEIIDLMSALKASLSGERSKEKPVSLADRKPPKRSAPPVRVAVPDAANAAEPPKKRGGSKR